MNKKTCSIWLWALIIFMEWLPCSAVCIFADSPSSTTRVYFSYFDLTPFGYANFGPLLTALLSVVAIFILAFYLLNGKGLNLLKQLSLIAFTTSLLPLLMFGPKGFSILSVLISFCLFCSWYWCRIMEDNL